MRLWLSRLLSLRPDPVKLDWVLALLLTIGAEFSIWLGGETHRHRFAYALVAPAIMAPIAVRRHYPTLVGMAVPTIASTELVLWGSPQFVGYPVAYFCALYALTVWTPPRRFAAGFALIAVVGLAADTRPGVSRHNGATFTVVTLGVMLLVRRVVGDRERRAQIAERERDVAAREAVVEERARIARELHDVIAHHVAMIVLQAGAERRVLGEARGSTHDVLEMVEQAGRSALTEMRRLLGMLRGDADEPLTPQPGLDDVPALVGQLCEAGLPVDLLVDGERRDLPAGIELSAYRIVQEALTNALKHGGDARATVRVRYGTDSLELEIADDGPGGTARASGGGHGLVGMRERVALYGGRFDAHLDPRGGFVVRALLPTR